MRLVCMQCTYINSIMHQALAGSVFAPSVLKSRNASPQANLQPICVSNAATQNHRLLKQAVVSNSACVKAMQLQI